MSKRARMNSDTKREALIVFLLLAFTFAYFFQESSWNGNSRLALTFAIVQEGRLTIDSFHDQEGIGTGDKSFFNGHFYSDKAIGTSLIAALFYFPLYRLEQLLKISLSLQELKYLLTFFSVGLPSALTGTMMYVLCKQVTGDRLRSYAATIAVSFGSMILPFSVVFFSHQLAGSLLFGAFFIIFQLKQGYYFRKEVLIFLLGFLLGFSLITEYTAAPIVLILIAYYFFTLNKHLKMNHRLGVILLASGTSIPVAILLIYNLMIFGNPFTIGYAYESLPTFQAAHAQGLMGVGWPNLKVMFYLTLHPAMGLFWQSPVLILALVGIGFMARVPAFRLEALVSGAAFLVLLLINSGYYMWWGGFSFGPRHLIPMLPFLCLPLVFIPKRWFLGVVILGLISSMQMFFAVSSRILAPDDYFQQIDQAGYFAYSTIYDYCLHRLRNGLFAINIGQKLFDLQGWLSLVPLILVNLTISLVFVLNPHFAGRVGFKRFGPADQ